MTKREVLVVVETEESLNLKVSDDYEEVMVMMMMNWGRTLFRPVFVIFER